MEIVYFFGMLIVFSVVLAFFSKFWFLFRWYVFGWRPAIFDKKIVEQTAEECAQEALVNDAKEGEERYGHTMTEEEKKEHYIRIKTAAFTFIERYIAKFSLAGKA